MLSASRDSAAPIFVFMHIPKTAGSTLREIVAANTPPGGLLTLYEGELRDALESAARGPAPRAVMGHFRFGIELPWSCETLYCTFLREPVAQVVSHYNHIANSDWAAHRAVRGRCASLEAFAADRWSWNCQASYVSGRGPTEFARDPERALAGARRHLRERFVAVGVTERFDESLLVLEWRLGWRSICYRRENLASQWRSRILPEELAVETLARIHENTVHDRELYRLANERLDEQIAEIPQFARRLRRFREMNALHDARAPG